MPKPTIFFKACELLGVKPEEAVWGSDVYSFKGVYFSAAQHSCGIQTNS